MDDFNFASITGIKNLTGNYCGPVKNHAPNPGNHWSGMVITKNGSKYIQEKGREACEKKMIEAGADPSMPRVPRALVKRAKEIIDRLHKRTKQGDRTLQQWSADEVQREKDLHRSLDEVYAEVEAWRKSITIPVKTSE